MNEKGGNFCILPLKIAEKEGKTDLARSDLRHTERERERERERDGQREHSLSGWRRGATPINIGFFLHFLVKWTKKGAISAFSYWKSQKKREKPTSHQ
jgi:hypothetical protein